MKNSNKKGFTLVELLVVIAILAILATVAVVGYTSFTDKANISNDTVIAKELTTLVQATDINDPVESFDDVMDVLYANGFYLANLNTKTAGCYFVWESSKNEILLVDGDDNYTVLYPESYTAKGNTWYVITSNKADYDKVSADLADADVNVRFATATISSLKEMIAAGGEQTIYIDDSLEIDVNNPVVIPENANITIHLNNSYVTGQNSEVLTSATVPFQVSGGNATIQGGVLDTYSTFLNADNKPVNVTLLSEYGATLYVKDTTINASNQVLPVSTETGSTTVLENVVVTGNGNNIIGAYTGSNVTLKNCTITAEYLVVFSSNLGDISSTITIDGGTYKTTGNNLLGVHGGQVIVNEGDFDCGNDEKTFKFYAIEGSSITIKGGTFNGIAFENLTVELLDSWVNRSDINVNNGDVVVTKNAEGHFVLEYQSK